MGYNGISYTMFAGNIVAKRGGSFGKKLSLQSQKFNILVAKLCRRCREMSESTRISTAGEKDRRISGVSRAVNGSVQQHPRATALTFASITNGVALGVGVYQTMQGSGVQYFYALNFCTFVLMVRLWWSYVRLSYDAPSSSLDQYCVDFAIAAIGISAVFFFNRPDRWALCYAAVFPLAALKAAQLAATLDPVAYKRRKDYCADLDRIHCKIPRYLFTAAVFWVIWLFCYLTENDKTWVLSCAGVLLVGFFIYFRRKAHQDFFGVAKKAKKGHP